MTYSSDSLPVSKSNKNIGKTLLTPNNINGLGGETEIIPISTPQDIFSGYFYTRDILNAFVFNIWECKKVVNTHPNAMMHAWGHFDCATGDRKHQDAVQHWINSLRKKYNKGQKLANRQGGSTYIRFVDDGKKLDEPVDLNNIKSVRYSRLLDRWECYPEPQSLLISPERPTYYTIIVNNQENLNLYQQLNQNFNGNYLRIHRDRILRFDGDFLEPHSLVQNQGWCLSNLITFLPPCMRYLEAMGYVAGAMKSFELVLFLVDDLFKLIDTPSGREAVQERAKLNQEMVSAIRAMMADRQKEDVKVVSRNFTGVKDNIEMFKLEMQGASGLDEIELFQMHPKGMAQTGQSQRMEKARAIKELCEEKWGDNLRGSQSDNIIGDLELFLLSDESPYKNTDLDNLGYSWNWNSSIESTPLEKSKIYLSYSQGDRNYQTAGNLGVDEVRSRFSGDVFNENLILNSTPPVIASKDGISKFVVPPEDNILMNDDDYDDILSLVEQQAKL